MPVAGFKFRKSSRLVAGLAVAASAALGIGLGGGAADAAPQAKPLPYYSGTGNNFGTFGDHDACRGALNVGLTSPKRGVVRVKITSFGLTGDGAGWKRNPRCSVVLIIATFGHEEFMPVTFGPKRGETASKDIHTGSGVVPLSIAPHAKNTPIRVPVGYGFGSYVLVP